VSTVEGTGTAPTTAIPTTSGAGASVARTVPLAKSSAATKAVKRAAAAVVPVSAPAAADLAPDAAREVAVDGPTVEVAPASTTTVAGIRRIRLTVSRVDPWSTAKVAFLLSVAFGIALVVMTAVLWTFLNGMGAFTKVNSMIGSVIQEGGRPFDIMDFVGFGRIISLAIVFAVIDVLLLTTLATLAAFLYNVSSSLVGGVQMTLSDE
jgi:hypothetical protein